MNEDHPIYKAIDRGGGQTCDISGVVRELDKAGYAIVPKMPTDAMVEAMKPLTNGPPTHRWQWIWNELIAASRDHQ